MDITNHSVSDLFAPLGLPKNEHEIQVFVAARGPLQGVARLADAPFRTESKRVLGDEMREDAGTARSSTSSS